MYGLRSARAVVLHGRRDAPVTGFGGRTGTEGHLAGNREADVRAAPAPNRVEVPDDLNALAMLESEEWAQEDARQLMREKFTQLKDWQKVRVAFGIGELPA